MNVKNGLKIQKYIQELIELFKLVNRKKKT